MGKRPPSTEPWSIATAAAIGGLAGTFAALIRHFSHDHSGYAPAEQSQHYTPEVVATAIAFAILGAIVAIVRNRWKKR
jgi:hypothetical protein